MAFGKVKLIKRTNAIIRPQSINILPLMFDDLFRIQTVA